MADPYVPMKRQELGYASSCLGRLETLSSGAGLLDEIRIVPPRLARKASHARRISGQWLSVLRGLA